MKVIYITQPSFLDYSIEIINRLQHEVELHVFVIVAPFSIKSTILNLEGLDLSTENKNYTINELDSFESIKIIKEKTNLCKSFVFSIFPSKSLSFESFLRGYKLGTLVDKIKPSIIHLDDLGINTMGLLYKIKKYPNIVNVHDPEPHSGEKSWKTRLIRKYFYKKVNAFNLFSEYSENKFKSNYNLKVDVIRTWLLPYYSYNKFNPMFPEIQELINNNCKNILFFGRISKYKGIEILLKAFVDLKEIYKDIKLIIAGKSNYTYKIPLELRKYIGKDLIIIDRYINNEENAFLMKNSSLLVCPYLDATQSGVLMTAAAFKLSTVITNVGGMPEYSKITRGIVCEPDNVSSLIKAIVMSFEQKDKIINFDFSVLEEQTVKTILKTYKELL